MSPFGRPGFRRAGVRVLVLVLGLSAALLTAEGLVRLVQPQYVWIQPDRLYIADPPGRYRLRAGIRGTMTDRTDYTTMIVTNSSGLRVPAAPAPLPANAMRILAIGDSFTFGVGVEAEETWVERLGAALAAEGHPVEVVNGGVPGYGAPDEVGLFERHLQQFRPELVILAVYVGNDLLDASPASLPVEVKDDALMVAGHRPTVRDWLNRHSHLFVLIKNAVPPKVQRPVRRFLGIEETPTVRQLTTEMGAFARSLPEGVRIGAQITDETYGRLVADTRASGARLVAMIIPDRIQLIPELWKAHLDYLGLDPSAYDPARPTAILRELLDKHGIPALDLTPAVAAELARGKQLYLPIDFHFTPDGHALAARELENFLRSQRVLPTEIGQVRFDVHAARGTRTAESRPCSSSSGECSPS